jgi:NADPH-dependent curcumin reductase CurA
MDMTRELERIVLVRHVEGLPRPSDFRIERAPIPPLAEGQFLIANRFVSCDPGTRSRLSPGASYARPVMPGEPVDGFCIGHVVESRNPAFPEGALVTATGWASHVVSSGRGYVRRLPPSDLPLSLRLGVLGIPGLTAWFALHRVAMLKPGERVLITSAAGPVGATAGQLARTLGADTVIGTAGGPEKCRWLVETAGFTHALDYKASDFEARFAEVAAGGIDVMLDNVGSTMIEAALPHMRTHGRIVLSGATADYSADVAPGVTRLRELITRRLRMEGILVFDDLPQFPEAEAGLAAAVRAGLAYREEIFEGLHALPEAFCGLFTGLSFGRRLVRLPA